MNARAVERPNGETKADEKLGPVLFSKFVDAADKNGKRSEEREEERRNPRHVKRDE